MAAIVVLLIASVAVGVGAAKIGYSGFVWFFLTLIGGPFTIGLLSSLADRQLAVRRKADLASLRQELAEASAVASGDREVPQETIGDLATIRN